MRRRWPWAVVGVVLVLSFLAGVGVSLMPVPAPKAATTTSATPTAGGSGVLAALARPQQARDRPRIPVGARLTPSTFRILEHGTLADLYVARDASSRICLVAVTTDDHFAAACGTDATGLPASLRLRFTAAAPGGADPSQLVAGLPAPR
ncbi:MAG TPA: hypothetical protein VIG76_00905 [Amnibacterium sp.]|jgi:hypothetical protein|uniref:hypothetical protein n=1 Tax=Amnibacterium sp. TaxID=1872496 RepID=UPI002F92B48D